MKLSHKRQKFTLLLAKLIQWANDNGYVVALGEVTRTAFQQAEYIRTGKSKTADSAHLESRAADLFLYINDEYRQDGESYRPLGEKWEALGREHGVNCVWGGRFGVLLPEYTKNVGWDANHFELK